MDYANAPAEKVILSASHIFTTLNGLLLFLNLGFPFREILRRNKCTKWRNMGKCFHPRKDIKASKRIRLLNFLFDIKDRKRIRVLNFLFVSQIIHKTDNFVSRTSSKNSRNWPSNTSGQPHF